MRVFNGFDALPPFRHPAVTVGSFDGVHLGHRALIERLVAEARISGGESIVVTFDPHPRVALGRADGLRLLSTLDEKAALLEEMGVDDLIVAPFDRTFSALSGAEFVRRFLADRLGAEVLVAGYDHRFGHDRAGSIEAIRASGRALRTVKVDERNVGGRHVSSTVIRRLLDEKRFGEAVQLLGHPIPASALDSCE